MKPRMNKPVNGVMSLFLMVWLSGCASSPETRIEYRQAQVPRQLTEPVPVPELQGGTNGALESWAVDLLEALSTEQSKLRTIREEYGE